MKRNKTQQNKPTIQIFDNNGEDHMQTQQPRKYNTGALLGSVVKKQFRNTKQSKEAKKSNRWNAGSMSRMSCMVSEQDTGQQAQRPGYSWTTMAIWHH